MSKKRYFGTDGVRGRVGDTLVHPEFMVKLGWAAGTVLKQQGVETVLIGKDTRVSGYMLESALQAGLSAAGMNVILSGPMPTPAIAYLTRTLSATAGIVISASHNPYPDNGIKFFSAAGEKLSEALECAIETQLNQPLLSVPSAALGKAARIEDAPGRYIEFCKSTLTPNTRLSGLRIVVDAANGATYHIAPSVFKELGAEVINIHDQPNGTNINDQCGTTHPESLQSMVLKQQANLGVALDGDGDRALLVDQHGRVLDGDDLLYIVAKYRIASGPIESGMIGTIMSNSGLEHALERLNVPFKRTQVGDRHVLKALKENGWSVGGEPSGHIIHLEKTTSGDGIVSALQILGIIQETSLPLHELVQGLEKIPQKTINVMRTSSTFDAAADATVQKTKKQLEKKLNKRGRILLRNSGTEPVIRITVEAEDAQEMNEVLAIMSDCLSTAMQKTSAPEHA